MKKLLPKSTLLWLTIGIVLLAIFLRFYQVTSFPPSLYWEEMALGYDAYSILKTGKDHLGNPPSLVAFESYGDYKPALYFYLLVPSIAVFGLNEFAVRLPTMLAGVAIVLGIAMIAWQIAKEKRKTFFMIALFVAAISPWAIQFSRAAWESNVATAFIVWAVALALMAEQHIRQKKKWFLYALGSFLLLALSMYTYHSARFIAPLLGLAFMAKWMIDGRILPAELHSAQWKKQLREFLSRVLPVGIFFVVVILPLLLSFRDKATQERLAETSLFGDGHVIIASNACKAEAGGFAFSKVLCHRYLFYTRDFLQNYLQHFSIDFLFVHGDHNLRHSVQFFGQLYVIEIIFLFLGFVYLLKRWNSSHALLLFWLIIGIVPAALTTPAPHALRILPVMPVFLLLISFGVVLFVDLVSLYLQRIWKQFSPQKAMRTVWIVVIAAYSLELIAFWRFYSAVYPKLYSGAWQYGYRQVIMEVNKRKSGSEHVYFLREMDRPGMAYWFFSQTDPREVQKIDKTMQKDQGEFLQFENITFINFFNEAGPGLVASTVESLQKLQKQGMSIHDVVEIKDPAGKPIWAVYKMN